MKSKYKNQNIISEIKNLAKIFRAELKKTERVLRTEILRVEERVEGVEDGQKETNIKLNRIEKTLDGFVGRVDDLTIENKFGADHIHELRKQAKNHEGRITKLESPQPA